MNILHTSHLQAQQSPLNLLLICAQKDIFQKLEALLLHTGPAQQYVLHWSLTLSAAQTHMQERDTDLLLVHQPFQHDVQSDPQLKLASCIYLDDRLDRADDAVSIDSLHLSDLTTPLLEHGINSVVLLDQYRKHLDTHAQLDLLTGLANRQSSRERLNQSLLRARNSDGNFAVLILHIDDFHQINQEFGQSSGDLLISQVAHRLQDMFADSGHVARTAGVEFTLVLDNPRVLADMERIIQASLSGLSESISANEHQLKLTFSVGIVHYPEVSGGSTELLKCAALALKEAHSREGNAYCYYDESLNQAVEGRLLMESELRRALRMGEFSLYYQPRLDTRTENIVGVEGLIRWEHPTRGLISPMEFIPLAESTGLIVPIGYWVINQACKDLQAFNEWGWQNLQVAVNLSFRQFQDGKLQETICHILDKHDINPSRLEFELTETAVMQDPDCVLELMNAMQAQEVQFALDDFGTGYSSLAHLQHLPLHTLKIDRSFINNLGRSEDDQIIVQAMIGLAHKLKMKVVAEGVEEPYQSEFLIQENCDQVQGYLYSKPVHFDTLVTMLAEGHGPHLRAVK